MPTSGALGYDVFVTEPIPVSNPHPLPNGEQQVTPPLASTLVFGDTDAVLVDVPATSAHADLLVAGDVLYNGVHMYLAESAGGGRQAWLAAIDQVATLTPRLVIAGHKNASLDDSAPRIFAQTRAYLTDADRLLSQCNDAASFFTAMLALHPDRLNAGAVWLSANALYR